MSSTSGNVMLSCLVRSKDKAVITIIILCNNTKQWIKMKHHFRELTRRQALNQITTKAILTLLQKDHTFLK